MVKGEVTMQGTIDSLTKDSKRYEITISGAIPEWATACCDEIQNNTMIIHGDDPVAIQPTLDRLRADNTTIISVKPVRENLEDLFMRAVDNKDSPGAIQ